MPIKSSTIDGGLLNGKVWYLWQIRPGLMSTYSNDDDKGPRQAILCGAKLNIALPGMLTAK